jgi:selenium donor protein
MNPVYLDYNATTPIDDEVASYMIPFLKANFGNPGSSHIFGTKARREINTARQSVARLINCSASEVVFTSGGTESNNLAIRGIANAHKQRGNHIITSSIEHPAVLEVCRKLEEEGFRVSYLKVTPEGQVSLEELEREITESTILVSIMHANNETGIIQPIKEISGIIRKKGIIFHCDAAQTIGKIPVDIKEMGVDLLSLAAHKFYGPKGVGALFIKEGVRINKIMYGANHERNLRPGTENLLEIAGLGKAAEIAHRDLKKNAEKMRSLRNYLYDLLKSSIKNIYWNGNNESTLPNTLSVSINGLDSSTLLSEIPEIAISAGAACHADDPDLSYVLLAMGIPENLAMGTLRMSTGKYTSRTEIEEAASILSQKINLLTGHQYGKSVSDEKEIKLTRYTHGMGCACKISPRILEEVLKTFIGPSDPQVLVGTETSDDASVYRIDENTAIVQSVDFFTPVVDDAFMFGAITAANALSDIYAMGAKPLFALNIVAFPPHRLPLSVLENILKGANEVAKEAGIQIIGGHTIEDNEPKYGLAVTGIIHPDKILRNSTAKPGDVLILTKKIGTGILSTAVKRELCDFPIIEELNQSMRELNKNTSEVISNYPVSACTDVTGFGLLGHLKEMCVASEVGAIISYSSLLIFPGVEEFAAEGIIPGGTENNFNYLERYVEYDSNIPLHKKYILSDAQTSGGLLFTVSEEFADRILLKLKDKNIISAIIGRIVPPEGRSIKVSF